MTPDTKPITAREAAEQLGVDAATVRRWVVLGLVPAIRTPRGHYRLDAETVAQLVTPTRTPAAAAA